MSKIVTLGINYTPHHNTLTAGGKSHFSRVADGIAEFVDNSIQATDSQPESRNVHVSFFLNRVKETGFVTISDNGVGMTTKTIEQFATYALDRQTRFAGAEEGGYSSIGKFGVGAKQAGFYLGHRLRVITKCNDNPRVMEFVLDKEELEDKFKKKLDVYSGCIKERDVGDDSLYPDDERAVPSMQKALKHHEMDNDNFTMIVIKMHSDIVRQMLNNDRYTVLPNELAEIYHYHLHPEHSPKELCKIPKFAKSDGSSSRKSDASQNSRTKKSSKLHISCHIWLDAGGLPHIAASLGVKDHVSDPVQKCIDKAARAFYFVIEIPHPTKEKKETLTSRTAGKHKVEGVIFYYPSLRGKETRPCPLSHYESATMASRSTNKRNSAKGAGVARSQGGKGLSQASSSSYVAIDDSDDESTDELDDFWSTADGLDVEELLEKKRKDAQSSMVNIYWQNRLVPNSVLTKLPFFPTARTKFQCLKENIPENWRGRLKGFIYFDHKFTDISNNKLKLQFDPNIEDWMIEKARLKQISYPENADIDVSFKAWLQKCHKELDRDFKFSFRDIIRENNTVGHSAFFRQLTVGDNRCVLEPKNIVKLFTGKGLSKNSPAIYGSITGFEIPEGVEVGEDKHFGHGCIRYLREPRELFHRLGDESAPLHRIDFTSNDTVKGTLAEIERYRMETPQRVMIMLYPTINSKPIILKDTFFEAVGSSYYKITVQILNHHGKNIIYLPQTRTLYHVHLTIGTADFGTAKDVFYHDTLSKKDVKYSAPTQKETTNIAVPDLFYGFYGTNNGNRSINFGSVGEGDLKVQVIDPVAKHDMLPKPVIVEITTLAPPAKSFDLECITLGTWPLGSSKTIPALKFTFKDETGAVNMLAENVKVLATAPGMTLLCEGQAYPELPNTSVRKMNLEDEGVLNFFDDQWQAEPEQADGSFLSPDEVIDREVEITFRIFLKRAEKWDSEIGDGRTITMIYGPGSPARIIQTSPLPGAPIELINGETAPPITIVCVDTWGNRTAPHQGENWKLVLEAHGPMHPPSSRPSYTIPVLTTGEALISDFTVTSEDGFSGSEGSLLTHKVELETSHGNDDPNAGPPNLELEFLVKPSHFPSSIEVLYEGRPIPNPWPVSKGSVMKDLTLRVLDEGGDEIQMEACWFKNRSSGLDVSWAPPIRKIGKKLPSAELPEIKVPSNSTAVQLECSIELKIDGDSTPLLFQFDITITSAKPVGWKIVTSENLAEGIMSGSSKDLLHKIRYVCLIDEYGNFVSVGDGSSPDFQRPVLIGSYTPLEDEDEETGMDVVGEQGSSKKGKRKRGKTVAQLGAGTANAEDLEARAESHAESEPRFEFQLELGCVDLATGARSKVVSEPNSCLCFILVTGSLVSAFPAPSTVWLRAHTDPQTTGVRYRPFTQSCAIIAGLPYRFEMSSHELGTPEPSRDIRAEVMRFTEVPDLTFRFFDEAGNVVFWKPKHWELKVSLLDPSANVVKVKVLPGPMTVSFKLSKVFDLLEKEGLGTEDFALQVTSWYKSGSSTVHLQEGTIHCTPRRLNTVSAVNMSLLRAVGAGKRRRGEGGARVGAEGDSDGEADRDDDAEASVTVDETLFSLRSTLVTDDDSTLCPAIGAMTVTAERGVLKDGERKNKNSAQDIYTSEPFDLDNMFSLVRNEDKGSMDLVPKEVDEEGEGGSAQASSLPLGRYTFTATYIETRENLASIPDSMKTRSASLRLHVTAGAAARIRTDARSITMLDNAAATNMASLTEEDRTIAKNVTIEAEDQYGNVCRFPKDATIACSFRYPEDEDDAEPAAADDELPVLKGSTGGYLTGRMSLDGKSCRFPILELVAGAGKGDRLVDIVFSLYVTPSSTAPHNYAELAPSLEAQAASFTFSTDQGQLTKRASIKSALDPLMDKYRAYHAEKDDVKHRLERCTADIDTQLRQLSGYADISEALTQGEASDLARRLAEQKSDMETSRFRAAKKEVNPSLVAKLAGFEVVGFPIDLGYVEDYDTSYLLSWVASNFMDTVVVRDTETLKGVYARKVKVMALSQVLTYRTHGRDRNAAEIASGQLPLPSLAGHDGNPRYMVNLMKLDPKYEHLRDTLFYNIFKKTLIFDNMSDALKYRSMVIKNHEGPPAIYTMEGDKIGTDGVMDPKKGRKPENLRFVFGMQPPQKSSTYTELLSDIRVVTDLRELLDSQRDLKDHLSRLDPPSDDITQVIAEIQNLEQELEDMGRVGKGSTQGRMTQSAGATRNPTHRVDRYSRNITPRQK